MTELNLPAVGSSQWGPALSEAVADVASLATSGAGQGKDHGTVAGTVTVSEQYTVHEMRLAGNTILIPSGEIGANFGVRLRGAGNLTVSGAIWETEEVVLPGVILFVRWPSGWYVTAVQSAPIPEGELWEEIATDTFTAADGTLLTGHIASNGSAWAGTGTPALTINSNRVTFGTHGAASTRTLSVGGAHPVGLRVSADWAQNGGTVSRQGLGMNYASTTYGGSYDFTIRISQAGAFEYGGAGLDDLALTGTLTGHPTSGRLTVQVIGTAISVLINGTIVATGTLPGTLIADRVVMIEENVGGAMDNLSVESYNP